MKRSLMPLLPLQVQRSLERLGSDIRVARLKRNLTAAQMADLMQIHRSTYGRIEAGDAMVAVGLYARALDALGFGTPLDNVAHPRNDEEGLLLDLQRLPKRARPRQSPPISYVLPKLARARDAVVRIGVLGVMSGPAAPWGTVNRHCAEITAAMYNDKGGIDISGERHRIDIVCVDDRLNPTAAAEGARYLTEQEGVRYIIGPNVEQTFAATIPVAERNRAMLFTYSFTRMLYQPPRENAVLGQVAGYQAVPFIYNHLMEQRGVETIALVAPATPEGLRQRQEAGRIATSLGMRIVSRTGTYRSGAGDIEHSVEEAVSHRPDVLALPNVAPLDASRLIRRARELGFSGCVTTESAQDVDHLIDELGPDADDVVMVGGASLPDARSAWMEDFMARYIRKTGAWNDEAGTKAYALEFLLATLQFAGRASLEDVTRFKAAIPHFSVDNPLVKGRSSLTYYGAKDFRQKRQVGIPLVVNTINRGRLQTLFVQEPEHVLI